jgi:hypothetical protein
MRHLTGDERERPLVKLQISASAFILGRLSPDVKLTRGWLYYQALGRDAGKIKTPVHCKQQ